MAASCSMCRIGAGIRFGHVVSERTTSAMRIYKRGTVAADTDDRGSWRAQNEALIVVLSNLKY